MKCIYKARVYIHRMFECLDRKIKFISHLIDATEIVVAGGKVRPKRNRFFKQLDGLLVLVILNTNDGLVVELSSFSNGFIAALARSCVGSQKQQTKE